MNRWTCMLTAQINPFAVPPVWILAVVVVALIVALVVVGGMKRKLRTAEMKADAAQYIREDSLSLSRNEDMFLYESVERRRIEKPADQGEGKQA